MDTTSATPTVDEPTLPDTDAQALRGPTEPDSFVVQARYRAWNAELHILCAKSLPACAGVTAP